MRNAATLYDLAPAANHALQLAQTEATRYRQPLIGTEHLLLGLIQQAGSIAARVLHSLNITEARTRDAIDLLAGHGSLRHAAEKERNWTQRVQETIDLADRLRLALGADQIGPDHVLLALLDVPGNTALGIFQTLGVEREQLRGVLVIALQQRSATPQLTHLDAQGQAHMVDVGAKNSTAREAIARGTVLMQATTLQAIMAGDLPKGDVLATARIAGIMAAKKTSDLIPLCHPLLLTHVSVTITPDPTQQRLLIEATVRTTGPTGVEMEALTAVSVAALTIYDMCKAIDRGMRIGDVRLAEKRGGKRGTIVLDEAPT